MHMTCEPAFTQFHEADWFKRQRRWRADFQLSIDLDRQLSRDVLVGTNTRSPALPLFVIEEIPDAAAKIGPDLANSKLTRPSWGSLLGDCFRLCALLMFRHGDLRQKTRPRQSATQTRDSEETSEMQMPMSHRVTAHGQSGERRGGDSNPR